MTERRDRIPRIVERSDGIPRAMPLTLFDGASTDVILKKEKGLIIPEGLKVIFEVNTGKTFQDLGTITLGREFEGAFMGKHDQAYLSMPDKSSRVFLIPESDDRRGLMAEYRELLSITKPLSSRKVYADRRIVRAKERKYNCFKAVEEIDEILLKDFLEQRQEDLDFYPIDPSTVKRVRIQVAVDKKITASPLE
jgi:hypothetical protein